MSSIADFDVAVSAGSLDPIDFPIDSARTPFQGAPWLRAWTAAFSPAWEELHVARVAEAASGRPLFTLPLVAERCGSLTILTLPDRGVTDYQAPLVAGEATNADTCRLSRALKAALPKADLLLVQKTPERVGRHANPLLSVGTVLASPFVRHPLRLDADFASLRDSRFNGTCMRSLARKRRKLERKGRFEFAVHAGGDRAALDRVLDWRAQRFADRNSAEKVRSERVFYEALAHETGIARLALLTLDGEPIAGGFGVEDGGSFEMLCVAYDEAFKNYSPGLLLTESLIEWAVGRGLSEFDFTIGSEGYKFDFGVVEEPLHDVALALSLGGHLWLARRRCRDLVKRLAARFVRPPAPHPKPEAAAEPAGAGD